MPGHRRRDRRRHPEPNLRHLAYHILPVAGNGVWQWNLDTLRNNLSLFDGRKVVAICTAPDNEVRDETTGRGLLKLDPPGAVRDYLAGTGCEFLEVENDPAWREVKSWVPLWSRLMDTANPGDRMFYAHAKGVTRPGADRLWTQCLYESLLGFWPVVEEVLRSHDLAGSFKAMGNGFAGSQSSWHYAGSFFWARSAALFSSFKWRLIPPQWWGVEAWPGTHFKPECGGLVFYDGNPGDVTPAMWEEWAATNSGRRT